MAAKSPGGVEKIHSSLEERVWNKARLIWLEGDSRNIKIKEAIEINREIKTAIKTFYRKYEKADRKTRKELYERRYRTSFNMGRGLL